MTETSSSDLTRYLPLKAAIAAWLFCWIGLYAYATAATWNRWWPYNTLDVRNLAQVSPVIYATLGGGIGSTIFAVRGFYWAAGPQRRDLRRYTFDPNFVWWYIFRPPIGALLGGATYALIRGGVASFGGSDANASPAYFAVAFLAGFALHELLGWLTATGERIFRVSASTPTSRPADIPPATSDGSNAMSEKSAHSTTQLRREQDS